MVVLSGISALLLALMLGAFVASFGYRIFHWMTGNLREDVELRRGNLAAGLLAASFIFAIGYVLRSAIRPLNETLFGIVYGIVDGEMSLLEVCTTLLIMASQFAAAVGVASLTIIGAVRGFVRITQVDEAAEIRDGNVAVALVVAALTITFAFLFEEGVSRLLQVIIPVPEIRNDLLRPFG